MDQPKAMPSALLPSYDVRFWLAGRRWQGKGHQTEPRPPRTHPPEQTTLPASREPASTRPSPTSLLDATHSPCPRSACARIAGLTVRPSAIIAPSLRVMAAQAHTGLPAHFTHPSDNELPQATSSSSTPRSPAPGPPPPRPTPSSPLPVPGRTPASPHYTIQLEATEQGGKAVGVRWERLPAEGSKATPPGVCCLRTNIGDWDAERWWRTYLLVTDLEAVFRSLKSESGRRPIYRSKAERSEGHLFVTVLAYPIFCVVEVPGKEGWSPLRKRLERRRRRRIHPGQRGFVDSRKRHSHDSN